MPRRSRRALTAAALAAVLAGGPPAALPPEVLSHAGSFVWRDGRAGFGGFSGLDLEPDGLGFLAVTDAGHVAEGRLSRNAAGAVAGVELRLFQPLNHVTGRLANRDIANAEGLARRDDGSFYVSYEFWHRVERFAAPGAPAELLPIPRDFVGLRPNSGLEALALDHRGLLYAIPERSGALGRPFPVFRYDGTGWEIPFTLPREGAFLPVGADFGPDGMLYLLERDFRGLLGFRNRISRFQLGPEGIGPRELLLETRGPVHDNLESIAVWRDAAGAIRLTMLSDDNFAFFQRTEFVDYVVSDALARAPGEE